MKRAILTVGLGFGDEGKGATVDFLVRHFAADLVVRYCGGSQAGHNVQLPGGQRHTFSQFGAGTLAGPSARTYLGPNMIVDPTALSREAAHLQTLGIENPYRLLIAHPACLVTTVWHRTLNQFRELARGSARMGSCGQGIGETRSYWLRHGADAITVADLRQLDVLRDKVELLRQRSILELQTLLESVPAADREMFALFDLDTAGVSQQLVAGFNRDIQLDASFPDCRIAIFEGAQGVLLDEYRGFHPHTTWSTVTTHHAWELIDQMHPDEVTVLGLTRAYQTRHGAGPMPTYSADLTARLDDPGNQHNPWQGTMRRGWLDLELLRYAVKATGPLDGLVVNHLDEVDGAFQISTGYRDLSLALAPVPSLSWQENLTNQLARAEPVLVPTTRDALLERIGEIEQVVLTGSGPTHEGRTLGALKFRRRKART